VERRLYTAGTNKARLDPFGPEDPKDVAFVQDLLDALHMRFKDWVRRRRGDRLKATRARCSTAASCWGNVRWRSG